MFNAGQTSVLTGLMVRINLKGEYYLAPISHLQLTRDGRPCVAVLSHTVPAAGGEQLPMLRLVPISSVSGTSPLSEALWEAAGRREAAGLAATLDLHNVKLYLHQVSAAASVAGSERHPAICMHDGPAAQAGYPTNGTHPVCFIITASHVSPAPCLCFPAGSNCGDEQAGSAGVA